MNDFVYLIDTKIKNTIDNRLNPYLAMIRDKMREIDNKSTDAVLQVKEMLDSFLVEYNKFREEVSGYVENLNNLSGQLDDASNTITELQTKTTTLETNLLQAQTSLNNLITEYNNHLLKKYYSVSHYVNGGSNVKNYSILEGQSISSPLSTKDGYDFIGWYSDEEYLNKIDFPLTINDNMNLYAKWEEIIYYTITFNYSDVLVESITGKKGDEIELPTPTKDGYNFGGWYLEDTFETKVDSPLTLDKNYTLYAKWTEKIYYVVSFITSGTAVDSITVEQGGSIDVMPTSYKENYNFIGWYTDEAYTNKITFPYTPTESITLYAYFESQQAEYISGLNIRYIKWFLDREDADTNSNIYMFSELQAYKDKENKALNKPVTSSWKTDISTTSFVNDGNTSTASGKALQTITPTPVITIDLETPTQLDNIIYYRATSTNSNQTDKIMVSEDGIIYYVVNMTTTTTSILGKTIDLTSIPTSSTQTIDYSNYIKNIRYVRIKATGTYTEGVLNGNYGIAGLDCYKDGVNVAIGSPVRRNVTDGTGDWEQTPELTTGHLYGQNRDSGDGFTVCINDKYMEIDLGEEKDLDYIKIYPYDEKSNTIKNIQLEVSSDGITYYILNMYPSVSVTMTNTGTSTVHTNQIYYDLKEFLLPNLSITTEQTIE